MQVSVLGAGAWGTALATVFADKGHQVRLWTWEADHARAINAAHENVAFLSGVPLDSSIFVSAELPLVLDGAELVVVVVPSQAVGATAQKVQPFLPDSAAVVCATKGIDSSTLELMTEVLGRELDLPSERLAALSGPSFAREVAKKLPTNLVAASTSAELARSVQEALGTDWLRIYTSGDPIGVEVGGALKNVIAIAAGACDGLGLGENTRAALITRGIAEMARLAQAKGGDRLTMAGLAGVGDLVLTCTGSLSRNRVLGIKLGQGQSLAQALAESQGVAEGYYTAQSAVRLAQKLGVDLPIGTAVESVLYGGRSPVEALKSLLGRPLHAEWD
jgi:glycerol-3-phosphate dehydrogenase (NAD(P)+)